MRTSQPKSAADHEPGLVALGDQPKSPQQFGEAGAENKAVLSFSPQIAEFKKVMS